MASISPMLSVTRLHNSISAVGAMRRFVWCCLSYSGKFSNGANFRIIRKRASCAKIKTPCASLLHVHAQETFENLNFEILFYEISNLCKYLHQRKYSAIHFYHLIIFFIFVCYSILQLAKDYSTKRVAFRKYIADHPLHMQTLARMEVCVCVCVCVGACVAMCVCV